MHPFLGPDIWKPVVFGKGLGGWGETYAEIDILPPSAALKMFIINLFLSFENEEIMLQSVFRHQHVIHTLQS